MAGPTGKAALGSQAVAAEGQEGRRLAGRCGDSQPESLVARDESEFGCGRSSNANAIVPKLAVAAEAACASDRPAVQRQERAYLFGSHGTPSLGALQISSSSSSSSISSSHPVLQTPQSAIAVCKCPLLAPPPPPRFQPVSLARQAALPLRAREKPT